jgi:hypothetical protein
MDNPFNCVQSAYPREPPGERAEGYEDTLATTIDLRQFQDEPPGVDPERAKDDRSAGPEYDRLANQHQSIDCFFRQVQNLFFEITFKPYLFCWHA